MPRPGDLPESLMPLIRRNALEIRYIGFHQCVDVLIEAVERHSNREDVAREVIQNEPYGTGTAPPPYVARIDDLDHVLEQLLRRELPSSVMSQMFVTFEAPDEEFPPVSVSLPAVDLFLYDIEQHGLSSARKPSALPVTYSYAVTAWVSEGSATPARDEHFILSELMNVFTRYSTIPDSVVQVALRKPEVRLPTISVRPNRLQNVSEFWQSLRVRPRSALYYSITVTP